MLLVVLCPLALIVLVVAYFLLSFAWAKATQLPQAKAEQMCQDFYQDVQSQISAARYDIKKSAKQCQPVTDETGFTDYKLTVQYMIAASGADGVVTRQSLEELASKLPTKNYPVTIENILDKQGICVTAMRYIDNDGKDVPQGLPNGPRVSYKEPGTSERLGPCGDL